MQGIVVGLVHKEQRQEPVVPIAQDEEKPHRRQHGFGERQDNLKEDAPFTGAVVAVLVATFITFEAPFSGMSMNPARTLGPDVIAGIWRGLWIYFVAPPLGMLLAAEVFLRVRGPLAIRCAKLHHDNGPCIFNCSYS